MKRCKGCGSLLQTEHPEEKGFILKEIYERPEKNHYCRRCYRLIHYNRPSPVEIDDFNMREYIKTIDKRALIVNVVDIFDLDGSIVPGLNDLFPMNPIVLIANKFDVFLKSVRKTKVLGYLERYLKEKDVSVKEAIVASARSPRDLRMIYNMIKTMSRQEEVYFFGMTNVGKSTLVNGLLKAAGAAAGNIAESNIARTTLDVIKVKADDVLTFVDMPGLISGHQGFTYLKAQTQKMLAHKSYVRPRVYQLKPGQSLFLGGFVVLKFFKGECSSFIVYLSNAVPIHRTKIENTDAFFVRHRDDILRLPDEEERSALGCLVEYEHTFSKQKTDITFSGLGFVTFVGSGSVTILCYENIKVGFRKAII